MENRQNKKPETFYDPPTLADEPSGGRVKMWLVGVGVALAPVIYGVYCLISGHAILPGDPESLDVYGDAAFGLAIASMAVGLFIHAHWFWGLHPRYSFLCAPLKLVALVVFLASFGFGIFKTLAAWMGPI
jgi:hypothetical protein